MQIMRNKLNCYIQVQCAYEETKSHVTLYTGLFPMCQYAYKEGTVHANHNTGTFWKVILGKLANIILTCLMRCIQPLLIKDINTYSLEL